MAACSIDPPPPDRFFRIETAPPAASAPTSVHLQVLAVDAAGLYTERPLVFEREGNGGTLEQYHYYFWTEPPDLLLTDALVHYLRAALGPAQVFGPGGGVGADIVVRVRLRKLDQKLGSGGASSVLALQFTVEDLKHGTVSVVDFEEAAPAGNGAPGAHVEALERLSTRAFARLTERLQASASP